MSDERAREHESVGLCAGCALAEVQESRKGGRFWRCQRAETDPGFLRYPPLPVHGCTGFERLRPEPSRR